MRSAVHWVKLLGHFLAHSNRMSAPPPGYNPGETLLHGGNATIAPLMGGGGGFVEGTPGQSLLQGGDSANIVPLKGGANLKLFEEIEQARQEATATASAPVYTTIEKVVDEIPTEQPLTDPFNIIEKARKNAEESGPLYKPELETPNKEVNIIQQAREEAKASGPTYSAVAQVVPQMPAPMIGGGETDPIVVENVALSGITELADYTPQLSDLVRRHIEAALPEWKRHNIVNPTTVDLAKILTTRTNCIPPTGNIDDQRGQVGVDRLTCVLPRSTTRIIMFQPVRGDEAIFRQCKNYLTQEIRGDPNTVIIFPPPFFGLNDGGILNIYARFLRLKLDLKEQNGAAVYLLTQNTMFQKIVGCVISINEFGKPEDTNNDMPISNLLEPTYIVYPYPRTMPQATRPVGGILFSGAAADEVSAPESTIPNRLASIGKYVSLGGRNTVAFPPNTRLDDKILGKVQPYHVFRFYGEKAVEFQGVIDMKLKGEEGYDVSALDFVDETKFLAFDPDHLMVDEVQYELITLDGNIFSIRKPGTGKGNVTRDWLVGKFTKDEADMLNSLKLRPQILSDIFGRDEWPRELMLFLTNLVASKCYTDTALLTDARCDESSEFVQKVFNYFLENDERIRALEDKELQVIEAQTAILRRKTRETARENEEERVEGSERVRNLLASMQQHADLAGVDMTADLGKMQKNPFDDRRLTWVRQGSFIEQYVYQKVSETNRWCRQIVAIQKSSRKWSKAEMCTDAVSQTDANTKLYTEFRRLQEDYPGWWFLW